MAWCGVVWWCGGVVVQHRTAQLTTQHHLISIFYIVILLYENITILRWWYCGMVSICYLIVSSKIDTLHPLWCGMQSVKLRLVVCQGFVWPWGFKLCISCWFVRGVYCLVWCGVVCCAVLYHSIAHHTTPHQRTPHHTTPHRTLSLQYIIFSYY